MFSEVLVGLCFDHGFGHEMTQITCGLESIAMAIAAVKGEFVMMKSEMDAA